jgi:hypothetical protein
LLVNFLKFFLGNIKKSADILETWLVFEDAGIFVSECRAIEFQIAKMHNSCQGIKNGAVLNL